MRQRNAGMTIAPGTSTPRARSAPRRIGALALLLTLVTSALSGCIIVPVGHGHGRRGEYRHGYRHGDGGWDR